MKKLTIAMSALLITVIALPGFANEPPKTTEDCKKTFKGNDAKIRACIGSTLHRTVILSTDEDEAKIQACLAQLKK